MRRIIEAAFPIALAYVVGLYLQHPKTWRIELAKVQYSILKEVRRTDNWGCPSIFKDGCREYDPKRYR